MWSRFRKWLFGEDPIVPAEEFARLVEWVRRIEPSLVANRDPGTKLMALSAFELFRVTRALARTTGVLFIVTVILLIVTVILLFKG